MVITAKDTGGDSRFEFGHFVGLQPPGVEPVDGVDSECIFLHSSNA